MNTKKWLGTGLVLLLLIGCGGSDSADEQAVDEPTTATSIGQAMLGPLSGATINAYRLSDLSTAFESTTANSSKTDLSLAGSFNLELTDINDDEWIVVTATGGVDIDSDDDGVIDATPTTNNGTLHAVATAADWKTGGNISLLTEIVWQQVKLLTPNSDEFEVALQTATVGVLSDDLNADTLLDYRDPIAFNPQNHSHISNTVIDYQTQLAALANKIHSNVDEAELVDAVDSLYGDSLVPTELVKLITFSPELTVPDNVKSITSADLTVTSFVGDGDTIIDSEQPTLLMAENSDGATVLLGFAMPETVSSRSTRSIMFADNVEVSTRSTALALVMLKISVAGESASAEIAANILAHEQFDQLENLITDAFVNDPTFLDNLIHYTSIVELLSSISNEIFNDYLLQLAEKQTAAIEQYSVKSISNRSSTVQSETIDDFWCTPITGLPCSPWHKDQPWTWFGETSALNVTLPPFPAAAINDASLTATANPTMLNYVIEMYDKQGNKVKGSDDDDWYLVARNSTMIQRVANSNAAQTLYMPNDVFANEPYHIEYNKYWLDGGYTTPANINRAFHLLHLTTGMINIVADASFIGSYMHRSTKLLSVTGKAKRFRKAIYDCPADLVTSVDFTSDSLPDFVADNHLSVLETTITSCLVPIVKHFGSEAAKQALNHAVKNAIKELGIKFSNPAGWVKIIFDATNELAPLGASLFLADSVVGYDLTWSNGQLVDAVRNDQRPNTPLAPTAVIDATVSGLTVSLNASSSSYDESATPAFEWGLGDGSTTTGTDITHTYDSAGIKDIRLTIFDGLGQTSEIYKTIELIDGQPPEIISLSCENSDGEVTATVNLLDSDNNNQVTVDWYLSAAKLSSTPIYSGITDTNGEASATLNYNFSAEQYFPVVKATDASGNQVIDSCSTRLKASESISDDDPNLMIENWNKVEGTGVVESNSNGLTIFGSSYRSGTVLEENEPKDFSNVEIKIKWSADGDNNYMGVKFWLASQNREDIYFRPFIMTTDHSYLGSEVIDHNQTYYSRIVVSPSKTAYSVTSIYNFDDEGGVVQFSNIQEIDDSSYSALSNAYFSFSLGDNYGGEAASMTIEELSY